MKLQENIRRILREDKKTKSTNKEFSKYKNSKFNSLRDYTLQDIVDNWDSLSDHKNENIKTIKHFINNPDKITDLVYDEKGLEDGYHRLIAAKILKKPRFSYRLVENLQESIRRILKEESNPKQRMAIKTINDAGFITATRIFGGIKKTLDIIGDDLLTKRLKIKIISDLVYNHDDNVISIWYDMFETPIVLSDTDETLSQIEWLFPHYVSVYYYGGNKREQDIGGLYREYNELSDEVISQVFNMVVNYYIKYYHQSI